MNMDATRAKDAAERAKIAARLIRQGRTQSRFLFNCLEMGDGDEVVKLLRAMNDPRIDKVLAPV